MPNLSLLSYFNTTNIRNALFHLRTYGVLSMVRKSFEYINFTRHYQNQETIQKIPDSELILQRKKIFSVQPVISILVPVYKTPPVFLRQMIESVTAQTYSNWELCIADGSADDTTTYISDIITEYQHNYSNILYTKLPQNLGISGNTNAALSLASGDYIALLDHDDLLTPNALYEIVLAINNHPEADTIYTDEDKTDISLQSYYDPFYKPDFSPDLLRSCNYITHFYIVKKLLAERVGGFSTECNGSQDYDFILKTCELATYIHHIPKVLYHWRIHPDSVAGDPKSKTYAYNSAVLALQSHLKRCNEKGSVHTDSQYGYYRIQYAFSGQPKVSILLKSCSAKLRAQIIQITTYSNYEFIDKASDASGDFIIILYHTQQILTSDWIEQFIGNCSRAKVGIVSAKSYYKKKRILEAGLIYTPDGQLHSPFYQFSDVDAGYRFYPWTQRNCSLVSPYCIMTRTSIYKQYYAVKEKENITADFWYFCLCLFQKGLYTVILPQVSVLCTRPRKKLPKIRECLGKQDPFYNPSFSQSIMYHLP